MTSEQLWRLKKSRRLANYDAYIRKWALKQARFLFTSDVLRNYPEMKKIHIEKHNELYRKILNDPIYDARCFLAVNERE